MKKIEIVCQTCKNRCSMEVEYEGGELLETSGNGCMRGMIYAQEWLKHQDKEKWKRK